MTLREFQKQYENGAFRDPSRDTQIAAGWTDWFCPDNQLAAKLQQLWESILQHITSDFILDNFSVLFCNHCPCDAPLYDEILFHACDQNKADTMNFGVSIDSPHADAMYAFFSSRNYHENEKEFDTPETLIAFINNWEAEIKNPKFYEQRAKKDAYMHNLIEESMKILNDVNALLDDYDKSKNTNIIVDTSGSMTTYTP